MKRLTTYGLVCSACLALALALTGCELDENQADGTVGATDAAGGGDAVAPADATPDTTPTPTGPGCDQDGWCNPDCWDDAAQLPTDPDCNPNTPENSDQSSKNPNWSCDYWGFVCEADKKCSNKSCECDPDCTHPDGLLSACNSDGHCDTWCPTDWDPDCTGQSGNGKYCTSASCDLDANFCDAKKGSTEACPEDPLCDGLTAFPCEGDTYCDDKCPAGADPDC